MVGIVNSVFRFLAACLLRAVVSGRCQGVLEFFFVGTVLSWYPFYVGCKRKNVGGNLLAQTAEAKADTQQQSREKNSGPPTRGRLN